MSKYFRYFPTITYDDQVVTDITRRVKINDTLLNDPFLFLPYTVNNDDRAEDVAYYYYGDVNKVWLVYLANNIIDPYTQWVMNSDNFEKTIRKKYALSAMASSVTSNSIEANEHGFGTTDPVVFTGTIGGLTSGVRYYVIRIDNNTFKLASSIANARSGNAISLGTVGDVDQVFDRYVDEFLTSDNIDTNIIHCVNNSDDTMFITYDTYLLNPSLIQSEWTIVRAYEYEVEQNENRRAIWLINKDHASAVEADLTKVLNG
jgi:hypothetical protein